MGKFWVDRSLLEYNAVDPDFDDFEVGADLLHELEVTGSLAPHPDGWRHNRDVVPLIC